MTESDSGLIEERSTRNSKEGARACTVEARPEEYMVHWAVGLTMGDEEQKDGAGVCQPEGAYNGAPQHL